MRPPREVRLAGLKLYLYYLRLKIFQGRVVKAEL
jgi:hypothetical protein